jgi:hypothetical protein
LAGIEIKKVYDAARSLFLLTDEMLRALEAEMAKLSFEQKIQNKRMTSYDLGRATEWMPYFLELVFAKRGTDQRRGIGVAVLFDVLDRRQLEFPVVFAGALDFPRTITNGFSYNLFEFCRLNRDRMKELKHEVPFYTATFANTASNEFSNGVGYFLRLESLQDRACLAALIVEPCLELFNSDFVTARSAIAQVAVVDKEFFN